LEPLLDRFIKDFNGKSHLHLLIRNKGLNICFRTGKGDFFLQLENGAVKMVDGPFMEDDCITISADDATLEDVLAGRIKLREARSRRMLTLAASMRTLLLLESVLFLAGRSAANESSELQLKNS
jgi:hypothetical protein